MSEERAFEGVWIPAALWLDSSLTLQEKVMLVEIKSLSKDPQRGCYKSNAAFAEFFGVSASRISQVLSSLEKKGYISVRLQRKGKHVAERNMFLSSSYLEKLNTSLENLNSLVRKPKEGYLENCEGSNTSKSNTERVLETLCDSPAVDPIEEEFDLLWSTYPKRAGGNPKAAALKNYRSLRKQFSAEEILSGVRRYAAFIRATGKEQTEYVKQAKTFLGPDLHWQEEYALPVAKGNNHENIQPGTSKLQRAHDEINAAAARAASRANAAGAVEAHGAAVRPQMDLPAPAYGRR